LTLSQTPGQVGRVQLPAAFSTATKDAAPRDREPLARTGRCAASRARSRGRVSLSRITVRKAIDGLISEGMLVCRQGSGTFVCARVEKNFSKLTSLSEDMRARGRTPHSEWLKKSSGSVTPEEALTLRSSPGTPVFRFHRIRFADDLPMSVEYATVLASSLPSLEAVESSLYEALEHAGNRPVRALQRLRAVLLPAEQARLPEAKDAGLLVERLGFLKDGRAVEFTQSYYCGDIYDFVAELSVSS